MSQIALWISAVVGLISIVAYWSHRRDLMRGFHLVVADERCPRCNGTFEPWGGQVSTRKFRCRRTFNNPPVLMVPVLECGQCGNTSEFAYRLDASLVLVDSPTQPMRTT